MKPLLALAMTVGATLALCAQRPAMEQSDERKLLRERIEWLWEGPWGATDDRGESILLVNPQVRGDQFGFFQEFTFHDASPLQLRFFFRKDGGVNVSYQNHDVGSGNVPPLGFHAITREIGKSAWRFGFRPIVDLNGPPQLLRVEFEFEDAAHFTETIEWMDRGIYRSQTFHLRNYGPLRD